MQQIAPTATYNITFYHKYCLKCRAVEQTRENLNFVTFCKENGDQFTKNVQIYKKMSNELRMSLKVNI